jgi:hypothetical protein
MVYRFFFSSTITVCLQGQGVGRESNKPSCTSTVGGVDFALDFRVLSYRDNDHFNHDSVLWSLLCLVRFKQRSHFSLKGVYKIQYLAYRHLDLNSAVHARRPLHRTGYELVEE